MMFSMRTIWLKISTLQSDDHPQPHSCCLHSPMQTMWDEAMPRLATGAAAMDPAAVQRKTCKSSGQSMSCQAPRKDHCGPDLYP